MKENVIEWINDEDTIAVTFHQGRYINKVKALAKQDERVKIIAENDDGSIFAHLPIEMLKLTRKRSDYLSVEEKTKRVERMNYAREQKK